jgi:hypothetical protein
VKAVLHTSDAPMWLTHAYALMMRDLKFHRTSQSVAYLKFFSAFWFFALLLRAFMTNIYFIHALLPISNQKCRRRKFESILNLFEYVKKIQILPALSKHVGAGERGGGRRAGGTHVEMGAPKGKKGLGKASKEEAIESKRGRASGATLAMIALSLAS